MVTTMSGAAMSASVSEALLSLGFASGPLAPSSAMVAAFEIDAVPALAGLSTVTAKMTDALPELLGRLPSGNVYVEPSPPSPFAEDHPGVLWASEKVAPAGTVSVITAFVAVWSPTFLNVSS
jgi:hypothetical protein